MKFVQCDGIYTSKCAVTDLCGVAYNKRLSFVRAVYKRVDLQAASRRELQAAPRLPKPEGVAVGRPQVGSHATMASMPVPSLFCQCSHHTLIIRVIQNVSERGFYTF